MVLVRVLIERAGKVLAYRKDEGEWLSGQWEVPTFVAKSSEKGFLQYPSLPFKLTLQGSPVVKTGITKYGLTNHVWRLTPAEWKEWGFARPTQWRDTSAEGNLSTASLKCLKAR